MGGAGPECDGTPELELGGVVALVRAAGLGGLDPGNDVARGLNRVPETIGPDAVGQHGPEDLVRRGRVVTEATEEDVRQLVAPEGPRAERVVVILVIVVALRRIRVRRLEREAVDTRREAQSLH